MQKIVEKITGEVFCDEKIPPPLQKKKNWYLVRTNCRMNHVKIIWVERHIVFIKQWKITTKIKWTCSKTDFGSAVSDSDYMETRTMNLKRFF